MITNIIKTSYYTPSYNMETKYNRLVPNNGVVGSSLSASKSSFEDFDFVEYASQFKSSDFDINSLLVVGAYDMLKPSYISSASRMSFVDQFQNFSFTKAES